MMKTFMKFKSLLSTTLALLAVGFVFTACHDDDDPVFTNTVSVNGRPVSVQVVERLSETAITSTEERIELVAFALYTNADRTEGVQIMLPRKHMGKTLDLTKKWSIDGDLPTGLALVPEAGGTTYYFFCRDEKGDFEVDCFKNGVLTVIESGNQVFISALGVGLHYPAAVAVKGAGPLKDRTDYGTPIEVPFAVSYAGPFQVPEEK